MTSADGSRLKNVIGVATYRRPKDLEQLLDSLRPELTQECVVVVVDNDDSASAEWITDRYGPRLGDGFLHYRVEGRPGIAMARNATLLAAEELAPSADFLIFVDDDELITPGWLNALLHHARRTDAPAVTGVVHSTFPDDTPRWILRGGFHQRPTRTDGQRYWTTATNNTALNLEAWRRAGSPMFDPTYSATGGSDTEFFGRLSTVLGQIEFCDEATVLEPIPRSRLTMRWLVRRGYRVGLVNGRILRREHGQPRIALKGLRIATVGLGIIAKEVLTTGQPNARGANRLLMGIGILGSLMNLNVYEYKRSS